MIFLWLFLGLCTLCCCAPLRYLLSNEWPRLRQMLYFPLSGQMRWEHRTQRQRLIRRLGGVAALAVYWEGQGLDKKFGKDADYIEKVGTSSPFWMRHSRLER